MYLKVKPVIFVTNKDLVPLSLYVFFFPVLQEEAIPELEIDVDELLDMQNDEDRAARVKVVWLTSSNRFILLLYSIFRKDCFY